MGRPRVYDEDRIATAVRIDRDLHERLLAEAQRREVSTNRLINRMIADMLPEYETEAV